MSEIKLPPLPGHPEPHTMQWSSLELRVIQDYAIAAVLADRAQRDPSSTWRQFEGWRALYEELRAAIDGGSESMTHADALAEVQAWRDRDAAALAEPVPEMTRQWAAELFVRHLHTYLLSIGERDDGTTPRQMVVEFIADANSRPLIDAMVAAHAEGYRAGQAAAIPEGWVCVNAELLRLARLVLDGTRRGHWKPELAEDAIFAIDAALSAATTPPKGEE
jgi:hypothetical protein